MTIRFGCNFSYVTYMLHRITYSVVCNINTAKYHPFGILHGCHCVIPIPYTC